MFGQCFGDFLAQVQGQSDASNFFARDFRLRQHGRHLRASQRLRLLLGFVALEGPGSWVSRSTAQEFGFLGLRSKGLWPRVNQLGLLADIGAPECAQQLSCMRLTSVLGAVKISGSVLKRQEVQITNMLTGLEN